MADPRPPLATVEDAGPAALLTLRADLAAPATAASVAAMTGLGVPAPRRLQRAAGRSVAWMAPDELLILLPPDAAAAALGAGRSALEGAFATLVEVTDALAAFRLTGARTDEVLQKLAPVDCARLDPDEVRRTRAGQIGVTLWRGGPAEVTILCARSVADYLRALLTCAARPGGEVFP